jgi:hypothetical protein
MKVYILKLAIQERLHFWRDSRTKTILELKLWNVDRLNNMPRSERDEYTLQRY